MLRFIYKRIKQSACTVQNMSKRITRIVNHNCIINNNGI